MKGTNKGRRRIAHNIQVKATDGKLESYVEKRGLRELRYGLGDGSKEKGSFTDSEDPSSKARFLNAAANALLSKVGEQTLENVIDETKSAKPNDEQHAISAALINWISGLIKRYGVFSPVTVAAQFLNHQHTILSNLVNHVEGASGDQISDADAEKFSKEMLRLLPIIYALCDSWHWWRMELYGDHAKLIDAQDVAASRQKGSASNKNKKEKRQEIIASAFDDYRASGGGVDDASAVAESIKQIAKTKCAAEGLAFISNDQLIRVIRRLKATS